MQESRSNKIDDSPENSQTKEPKEDSDNTNSSKKEDLEAKKVEKEESQQEDKETAEINRMAKPFWLAKIYVKFPWIVVAVSWLVILMCFGITAIFGLFSLSDSEEREFFVWSDPIIEAWDMKVLSQEDIDKSIAGSQQALQTNQPRDWNTNVYFTCHDDDCNVFSPETLKKQHEAEQKFIGSSDYSKYCKAVSDTDSSCAGEGDGFLSIGQKYFSAQLAAGTLSQADLTAALPTIRTDWADVKFLFGKDFDQSSATPTTKFMRSQFKLSNPIDIDGKRYKSAFDDEKGQLKDVTDFMVDVRPDVEDISTDSQKVRIFNIAISNYDFT